RRQEHSIRRGRAGVGYGHLRKSYRKCWFSAGGDMVRARVVSGSLVAFLLLVLGPSAWAQQTLSGLSGVVKDAAGTPVAGATVEAASPALIERVRLVVTDGSGQY